MHGLHSLALPGRLRHGRGRARRLSGHGRRITFRRDAVCLAGGSLYGLEAASRVAAELLAERRYATGFEDVVAVSGSIIYDYFGRRNSVYPDKALGRAAARTARPGRFPLGRGGADRFAACGGLFTPEPAGRGGAFREMGQIKVAAFVVVNSLGAILDRSGRVVKGAPGLRRWPGVVAETEIERRIAGGDAEVPPFGNTTLAVVVTKRRMSQGVLAYFGRQLHASLARAVQPFHSAFDGDALYAITTGESPVEPSDDTRLGIVASEVAWDAILSIP